jgi:hypothetical protein
MYGFQDSKRKDQLFDLLGTVTSHTYTHTRTHALPETFFLMSIHAHCAGLRIIVTEINASDGCTTTAAAESNHSVLWRVYDILRGLSDWREDETRFKDYVTKKKASGFVF